MSMTRTSPWRSSSIEPALIRLNAADEMHEFWEATRELLHLALPIHFCCLCFRPFNVMPATVFRERAPFENDAQFQRFRELCPFTSYIEQHPGVRVTRLSDIIETPRLMKSAFFRSFMRPCGDQYQACLVLWESSVFQGLVGLHRTAEQRDFTATEIHLLHQLYPHFDNAARRVLSSHREKARRISLEVLLSRLPIATIVLDWELRVTYRNRAAEDLGILWNLGPQAARSLKPNRPFEVPIEIAQICRGLKDTWSRSQNTPFPASDHMMIEHWRTPGLRASVNVLQMDSAPLSQPMFLVTLEHREMSLDQPSNGSVQLALWAHLTRSEQQVASLVGRGYRNTEIAQRLNKSAMTVKKQLQSVYHKLDVTGRGRLMALLVSRSSTKELT
jgi:DNA-binding CsgD family transcriptional regulator/PAS domain-containing protein